MDFDWLGTDSLGNIAVFNSGETGAIPKNAWRLLENIPEFKGFSKNFQLEIQIEGNGTPEHHCFESREIGAPGTFFIEKKSDFAEYVKSNGGRMIGEGSWKRKQFITMEYFWSELFEKFHLPEINESCMSCSENGTYELESYLSKGIFYYECVESVGVFPYKRRGQPDSPLNISDLPEKWMKRFQKIEINGSFKDLEWIQPIERFKCLFEGRPRYYLNEDLTEWVTLFDRPYSEDFLNSNSLYRRIKKRFAPSLAENSNFDKEIFEIEETERNERKSILKKIQEWEILEY